ncbi:MAG: helix-turn-helix domain-containing protein [Zetaproteobacteria bacterium]|nr:helix-turn-helix domain-containing protein [Zetaproteobacteria bacterium]
MDGMDQPLWTVAEVAKYLKLAERTIRKWAAEGVIPAYRIASEWRFCSRELSAWKHTQRFSRMK